MKRLIFLIFTIICGIILYTCASPLAVEGLQEGAGTYYSSKPIMGSGTSTTYLGVSVTSTSITIGFTTDNTTGTVTGGTTGDRIDSAGTNTISGTYPNISFQDGIMSGTIKFTGEDQLKITFQQRIYPYLKMWDVVCEKP